MVERCSRWFNPLERAMHVFEPTKSLNHLHHQTLGLPCFLGMLHLDLSLATIATKSHPQTLDHPERRVPFTIHLSHPFGTHQRCVSLFAERLRPSTETNCQVLVTPRGEAEWGETCGEMTDQLIDTIYLSLSVLDSCMMFNCSCRISGFNIFRMFNLC